MEEELKSEWLVTQIELMKKIHGYEREGINEEIGSIDYVAGSEDHGEKLLMVVIDPEPNPLKVYMETTIKILESLKNKEYNEVTIIAEDFTEASKKLLRKENIEYITHDKKPRYSNIELIEAIYKVTYEL